MSACNFDAEELIGGDNCSKTGGLKQKAYYSYTEDLDAPYPAPMANPTTFAESVTVSENYTMKTGKYFQPMKADIESSSLNSESQGNKNNLSAKNTYKFRTAGTSRQMVGFLNANLNRDMEIIAEDVDGNLRKLGQDGLPAKIISFKEVGGEKTSDEKYIEFIVEAPGKIAMFYDGIIPLPPVV